MGDENEEDKSLPNLLTRHGMLTRLQTRQNTSSEASTSTARESNDGRTSPEICSICLEPLQDPAFSNNCSHIFCFKCLEKWCEIKSECPLCKKRIRQITSRTTGRKKKINLVTLFENPVVQEPNVHSIISGIAVAHQHQLFRRRVYDDNLWVLPSNVDRFRESSPSFYNRNSGATIRLSRWLFRELRSAGIMDRAAAVDIIIQNVRTYNIQSEEFLRGIQNLFENRVTAEHFVHEFYHFAISPYEMEQWDNRYSYANYSDRARMADTSNPHRARITAQASVPPIIIDLESEEAANTMIIDLTNDDSPHSPSPKPNDDSPHSPSPKPNDDSPRLPSPKPNDDSPRSLSRKQIEDNDSLTEINDRPSTSSGFYSRRHEDNDSSSGFYYRRQVKPKRNGYTKDRRRFDNNNCNTSLYNEMFFPYSGPPDVIHLSSNDSNDSDLFDFRAHSTLSNSSSTATITNSSNTANASNNILQYCDQEAISEPHDVLDMDAQHSLEHQNVLQSQEYEINGPFDHNIEQEQSAFIISTLEKSKRNEESEAINQPMNPNIAGPNLFMASNIDNSEIIVDNTYEELNQTDSECKINGINVAGCSNFVPKIVNVDDGNSLKGPRKCNEKKVPHNNPVGKNLNERRDNVVTNIWSDESIIRDNNTDVQHVMEQNASLVLCNQHINPNIAIESNIENSPSDLSTLPADALNSPAQQNSVIDVLSSDEEDVQIVGVLKPRAERTPEIVDLSSEEIIEISSDEDIQVELLSTFSRTTEHVEPIAAMDQRESNEPVVSRSSTEPSSTLPLRQINPPALNEQLQSCACASSMGSASLYLTRLCLQPHSLLSSSSSSSSSEDEDKYNEEIHSSCSNRSAVQQKTTERRGISDIDFNSASSSDCEIISNQDLPLAVGPSDVASTVVSLSSKDGSETNQSSSDCEIISNQDLPLAVGPSDVAATVVSLSSKDGSETNQSSSHSLTSWSSSEDDSKRDQSKLSSHISAFNSKNSSGTHRYSRSKRSSALSSRNQDRSSSSSSDEDNISSNKKRHQYSKSRRVMNKSSKQTSHPFSKNKSSESKTGSSFGSDSSSTLGHTKCRCKTTDKLQTFEPCYSSIEPADKNCALKNTSHTSEAHASKQNMTSTSENYKTLKKQSRHTSHSPSREQINRQNMPSTSKDIEPRSGSPEPKRRKYQSNGTIFSCRKSANNSDRSLGTESDSDP